MENIVKAQFDKQAENFSSWSVPRNEEYLAGYAEFCRLGSSDRLLDVACGTGEFVLYSAPRVQRVVGVDISDGMMEIDRHRIVEQRLANAALYCHDVTSLPFEGGTFSVVTCRNAFHHMPEHERVVSEMVRCCEPSGRISSLDIVAYEDPAVNVFFETLEKLIDMSHHRTLNKTEQLAHFEQPGLEIAATFDVEVELSVPEYLKHAKYPDEHQPKIERLLEQGLVGDKTSTHFVEKEGELFFKRIAFLVLAEKSG